MKIPKQVWVLSAIVVVIAVGAFFLLKTAPQTEQAANNNTDPALLYSSNSHMTTTKNAKVSIVEFGDYQCPACGAASPIVKQLMDIYQNNPDVNFVFRNFPLTIHKNAQISAEAAEAAGAQGKFWQMNEKLYETQNEWSEESNPLDLFVSYASELGLDTTKFKSDIQSNRFQNTINADLADGVKLGVNATPTFFINGEKLVGAQSLNEFKQKIDSKLK